MDRLAGYEAMRSRCSPVVELATLVDVERAPRLVKVLCFRGPGSIVAVDVAGDDGTSFQLVANTARLVPRLMDPLELAEAGRRSFVLERVRR